MTGPGDRRVVVAGFREASQATAAEVALRDAFDLAAADVEVGDIGGDPAFTRDSRAVLAGLIHGDRLDEAYEILARHGGRVLTDVPEAWASGT